MALLEKINNIGNITTVSEAERAIQRGGIQRNKRNIERRIRTQERNLRREGVELPSQSRVRGALNGVFNVILSGERAVGGILAGEGIIEGQKQQISPSEALGITVEETESIGGLLKQPSFYTALAVDIILDPYTYLTFGFGAGAKISTKIGTKILNKEGVALLKKAGTRFGEDTARQMVATRILREGGEKYLSKGGLNLTVRKGILAGEVIVEKELLSRSAVLAPFKKFDRKAMNVPFVGGAYREGKKILSQLHADTLNRFKPINKLGVVKVGGKLIKHEDYETVIKSVWRRERAQIRSEISRISDIAIRARKELGEEAGNLITAHIELQTQSGVELLDDISLFIDDVQKAQLRGERKAARFIPGERAKGVREVGEIPGYMRRHLTPEGRKWMEENVANLSSNEDITRFSKELGVPAQFAKQRKQVKLRNIETGEVTMGNFQRAGLVPVVREEEARLLQQRLTNIAKRADVDVRDIKVDIAEFIQSANNEFNRRLMEDISRRSGLQDVSWQNLSRIFKAFQRRIKPLNEKELLKIARDKNVMGKVVKATEGLSATQAAIMLERAKKLFGETSGDVKAFNLALQEAPKLPKKAVRTITDKETDDAVRGIVDEINKLQKVAIENTISDVDVANAITAFSDEFRKNPTGIRQILKSLNIRKERISKILEEAFNERIPILKELGNLPEGQVFFKNPKTNEILEQMQTTVGEINQHFRKKYDIDFNLFEPNAFRLFAKRTAEHYQTVEAFKMARDVTEQFSIPVSARDGTGKAISQFMDGIRFVEPNHSFFKGRLFAQPIAKDLDKTFETLTDIKALRQFTKIYDAGLSFFKKNVTGVFPAFHTRNFIGGTWNNWLAGMDNPDRYRQWIEIANKDGEFTTSIGRKISYKEVREQAELLGVTGQTGMMDVMKTYEEMLRTSNRNAMSIGLEYPRIMMEFVEDKLRGGLFVDRLIKGDTFQEAANKVFKYHFDYSPEALTGFERSFMKRLIPFYVWTRNNIPLQIQELSKEPQKFGFLAKFKDNWEKSTNPMTLEEENSILPNWMKDMFIMRMPGESTQGLPRYLQIDLPVEDLNKLPFTADGRRELLALMSPFLKFPIERIANKNIYFGSEIYNATLPREFQTSKTIEALKFLPQPVKNYLNFQEVQYKDARTGRFTTRYEMDARKLHAIRSVLLPRYYSTLAQATDDELTAWMKLSRIIGGVPVRAVDVEEERLNRLWEKERYLRENSSYLRRRGVIRSGTSPAFPKGGRQEVP